MKESTLFKNTAFKDLQTIYIYLFDSCELDEKTMGALHRIYDKYGLDGLELRLIAYMAHVYPEKVTAMKVNSIIGEAGIEIPKLALDLKKRGFVDTFYEKWWSPQIALSARAVEAFDKYEQFIVQSRAEIIDFIRKSPLLMTLQDDWPKKLKFAMKMKGNEKFLAGWNDLHLDSLNGNEQKTLCFLLRKFCDNFLKPFKLDCREVGEIEVSDSGDGEITSRFNLNDCIDSLVQKGLAVSSSEGSMISARVAEAFLHGRDEIVDYEEISKYAQVIKGADIEKKELFFSGGSVEEIENLHRLLSAEGFDYACSVMRRKKRNPAILSLLWGGPGTGKTETVKQIARETGRDIFLFDVSKVTFSDWGLTEKMYRSLFDVYRYIAAIKTLTPILLINEADQVLSKRLGRIEHSIDKSENIVSNLLLQEFEDFRGILLATTNLSSILDEAFDRRFLFKTELQKPDARARESIWRSLIPELTEQESAYLAEKYVMSGAQINNVAIKRDLAELYFFGDRGVSYIEKLCDKELSTEKRNPRNSRIGF